MSSSALFFCLPDFSGGGAERVMVSLMRALADQANMKCLVLQETGPLRHSVPSQCKIINLNCQTARAGIMAMARTFRTEQPETIISTMAYFNFVVMMGLLVSGHKPDRIILREANTPSSTLRSVSMGWIYRTMYRWLYRRADTIICNSCQVREELTELKIDRDKIKVIPNPVDVATVQQKAKAEMHLPDFKNPALPFLVSIGRLTKQKGFDRLISWFDPEKMPSNLLIIGEGPEADALMSLCEKRGLFGRVSFLGFQENPFPYIAQATALLIASRWEGQPSVGLESLALGTRVVATSTSGGLIDLCGQVPEDILCIAEDKQQFIAAMSASINKADVTKSAVAPCHLPEHLHQEQVLSSYKSALGIIGTA